MSAADAKQKWADQISRALEMPRITLGPYASYTLQHDPRHLCFELARYKFCSRQLEGRGAVLEVGCGDGFGMPLVAQAVDRVHGIDTEPRVIEDNRRRMTFLKNATFECWNLEERPHPERFSAAYSLDVLEHIEPSIEEAFLSNLCASLEDDAVCVIGTPNVEAARFASESSNAHHVNLKGADALKQMLERRFRNGFLYSMNDEVVHTGFSPMAHYLIAVGVGLKR